MISPVSWLVGVVVTGALAGILLVMVEVLQRRFARRRVIAILLRWCGRILIVVLAVCFLPLALIEILLRYWGNRPIWSLRRRPLQRSKSGDDGRGSWVLPAEIASSRDSQFSATHWSELKQGLSLAVMERWQASESGPTLWRMAGRFAGEFYSFGDGERSTSPQPKESLRQVLCLGGSTTWCMEVKDASTWPSVLQQRLMGESHRSTRRVRNLGLPGAPGLERINTFVHGITVCRGDFAVFLFGDNDSGWVQYGKREGLYSYHLPMILRRLVGYGEVLELAGWLYGELAPRYLRRLAVEMAETTIAAAEDAAEYARSHGANVLFVLQPNIFTLARPDNWDRKIIAGTARDLPIMLAAAYQRYREWIAESPIAVDATHIFNGESPSPYMGDWSHVNTRGNKLIGEFVFDQLKTRGLLAPASKLK